MNVIKMLDSIKKRILHKVLDLSIKNKIQLSFVIISIIPLFILGTYSYQKSVQIIEVLASKYALNLIQEMESSVTNKFYEIDDLSKLIVDNKSIINILLKSEEEFISEKQYNTAQVKMSLMPFILNNEYIKNIYILADQYDASFSGSSYSGTLYQGFLNKSGDSYRLEKRYIETRDAYNNNKWWVEDSKDGLSRFILTRKVYSSEYGFLGVLVIEISKEVMENAERISGNFEKSIFYLLDRDNIVLYNNDISKIGKEINFSNLKNSDFSNVKGSFISKDELGKDILIVYNLFLSSNWKIILQIPYSEVIKEVDSIRFFGMGSIVVMTILTIIISIKFSSSIYNPLNSLIKLMETASKGDVNVRFNVEYQDDIGRLGQSFNQLMSDMEKLIDTVKFEQQEKAKMNIQMLEYQMNPHFLYNTFATMYWIAMEEGNYKLAQLSNSLSHYFKLGLNNGEEFTTVQNEVRQVEEYLKIQKERCEKNFDYEIYVEDEVKTYKTIKILLQPLVENSIIHGFKNSQNMDKKIKIYAFLKNKRITYKIEDNGKGIEDLEEKGLDYFIDKGFGIGNIIKRLKLFYKDDYTFYCHSIPNIENVFEISIPIRV